MTHNFLDNMRSIHELLARSPAEQAASRTLWAMRPDERVAAFWRGELTFSQCMEWSRSRPAEVPRVNGELAHIYMTTADYLDRRSPVAGNPWRSAATAYP